ncbi:Toucan [Operophtera brumata]|uniref:Toucan n=1 Tax=Operophtera brumata TaxID=104452 RepID=A0A0L7LAU5_OPEBR|nr:Toucan [Operophtera brumata]
MGQGQKKKDEMLDAINGDSWRIEAERWRGVAAAERTSAARADRDHQQRAQKDIDTKAERWRGVAAAERSSATRADKDHQQRAQKDIDTIAECLSKISELEMEVSSKEEANARLQAAHVEEVSALANDIKGLKRLRWYGLVMGRSEDHIITEVNDRTEKARTKTT